MLQDISEYVDSLVENGERFTYWQELSGKNVLITGATGLVGSYLVDMIMVMNERHFLNIGVIVMGRDEEKARKRFGRFFSDKRFIFIKQDMREEMKIGKKPDYIIHAASNAYPALYDKDPVGTMQTNILATDRLLKYSVENSIEKFLLISSGEIYGERNSDVGVKEDFCGYIDYMSSRSCYPVSKIAAETMCASYTKQYGVHTNVARLCHVYGPTMTSGDNRVINQFLRNVLSGEDIIMKSTGSKVRSYCYVADSVVGILYILCKGISGEAYNVAYDDSVESIKNIALLTSELGGKKVIMATQLSEAGATTIEKSVLNSEKLSEIGWSGRYNMKRGLSETFTILRRMTDESK